MRLEPHEVMVLNVLDEDCGFLTRDIAARVFLVGYANGRQRSAAVRSWLVNLRSRGLVVALDDKQPVCWKRTPSGTLALLNL